MLGIVAGIAFGFVAFVFKWLKLGTFFRFLYCVFFIIGLAVTTAVFVLPQTRFIAIIFFGYVCYRIWKQEKPDKELSYIWMVLMPLLFGSVGAAIKIDRLDANVMIVGFFIFVFGLICRFIATFFVGFAKNYNLKEKIFCAFAWVPKATVQAAIGGLILDNVIRNLPEGEIKEEYIGYGEFVLNTSVISIVISAPLGAIITNTMGPRWLNNDINPVSAETAID